MKNVNSLINIFYPLSYKEKDTLARKNYYFYKETHFVS